MNDSHQHTVLISPIGEFEPRILQSIADEVLDIFGFMAEVRCLLDDVDFAHDPERNQFHSTAILNRLVDVAPSQAFRILAITREDLFIPILTYVYGEAQLGGKACIISTHRLNEGLFATGGLMVYRSRLLKEAIHELGHTFNLRHCTDHSCIMHYCRRISDVDRKSDDLCRYCRIMLDDEIKRLAPGSAPACGEEHG